MNQEHFPWPTATEAPGKTAPRPASRTTVLFLGTGICLAATLLHLPRLLAPSLSYDDFEILEASWTWEKTWDNLWRPQNEHAMPLGRLADWLLIRTAGTFARLPFFTGLEAVLALLAGIVLLGVFVRREQGQAFVGLVAMALFGISAVYQQAVVWFASSFSLFSLDMLLLALLAAQRWRQGGRWYQLLLCAGWVALAPAWFAIGILAGPLCVLYLVPQEPAERGRWQRWLLTLAPLAGTVGFLAVSLPLSGRYIMHHLEHDDNRKELLERALEDSSFEDSLPAIACRYTCRSLVDHLALGAVGIGDVVVPTTILPGPLLLLGCAAVWWWWRARRRRLLLLGLGTIFLSYLLTYSARAHLDYEFMVTWGRYHLFPQLGLVLFICGGLPLRSPCPVEWTRRRVVVVGLLTGVLFLSQLPRGLQGSLAYNPKQMAMLEHIDEVDARCRQYHISATTARAALGKVEIPWAGSADQIAAYQFLRGSDDPHDEDLSPAEVRRLLLAP